MKPCLVFWNQCCTNFVLIKLISEVAVRGIYVYPVLILSVLVKPFQSIGPADVPNIY